MVSVGVSLNGCTELFFVDPGTKINGAYYRHVLLRHKLLPAIRRVSGKNFILQQDVHLHIALVKLAAASASRNTSDFISSNLWPLNSPDLNPVDYENWAVMQRRVYKNKTKIHTIHEMKQRLIEVRCSLEQLTVDMAILSSGVEDLELVCVRREGTSNIAFEITDCLDFVNHLSLLCNCVMH